MNDNATPALKTETEYPDVDPQMRRRSRMKLLLIFGMFAVPLLLASIYLQVVRMSGGSVGDTSRGQLIQPAVPLTELSLLDETGEPFQLDNLRGIWTMLYLPEGECDDICERNLYHMRQVRLALNHRMDRVQRVVLAAEADQLAASLLEQHPGLRVVSGDVEQQSQLRDQVSEAEAQMPALKDAIYLIDPLGNLMLRFSPDLAPKSMLKDIKHLLKVSRIG